MKRFEEKYFMTIRQGGGPGKLGAGGVGGGGIQALLEPTYSKEYFAKKPPVFTKTSIVNVNNVDLSSVEQAPKAQYKFPKSLQKIIDARNAENQLILS